MFQKLFRWCKRSESVVWARVKSFVGVAFLAVQQSGVDLTSFVESPKVKIAIQVFFAWLVLDGTLSEWARRWRTVQAPDGSLVPKDPDPKDQ